MDYGNYEIIRKENDGFHSTILNDGTIFANGIKSDATVLYKSIDGGNTWASVYVAAGVIYSIHCNSSGYVFIVVNNKLSQHF